MYVIATDSRRKDGLFMVDRNCQRASFGATALMMR